MTLSRLYQSFTSHFYWRLAVVAVIFLAIWLRCVGLGQTPVGLDWDEAALGYVGRMVITTGRDEHGVLLPRVFQSFGDYKTPLAFYITGISTTIFGLHPWAVRLPFALAGVSTVLLAIACIRLLYPNQRWLAVLGGWLLAVMPWHWFFSRIAFESGLALFFYLLLFLSWWQVRRTSSSPTAKWWWVMGTMATVAALYTYHAARLVVPLSLVLIFCHEWLYHRSWLRRHTLPLLICGGGAVLLLVPALAGLIWQNGAARASQTTIFGHGTFAWQWLWQIIQNLGAHWDWQFLVGGATTTLRHSTGSRGVLLYTQFFLLLGGVAIQLGSWLQAVATNRSHPKWLTKLQNVLPFSAGYQPTPIAPWFWLVLALVCLSPALIGWEVPHANRALFTIWPFTMLMVEAVRYWQEETPRLWLTTIIGGTMLLMLLETASFWRFYLSTYRTRSSADWLDGYAALAQMSVPWQRAGKTIKVASNYGQPQIFYGFFQNTPVAAYRAGQIRGVTFGAFHPQIDPQQFDMIVLSSDQTWPNHLPLYQILRADGTPAFSIYETTTK